MKTRDVQRRATNAKVLASADRLFRTQGFAQTTIREIAAAGGVSVGTVMSVGDKNALLLECFDQRIREVHVQRGGAADSRVQAGITEQIMELFGPFLLLFSSDFALARTYGSILVLGAHESSVFTELAARLSGEIAAVLREGGVPVERAAALAGGIYFAYIGRLFTWPGDAPDVHALRDSLRSVIAALTKHAGEGE
ncbi:TetR/AcrR family transcriptional regulator [Brevibacterium sp. 50QC2O2]|uniref:TetR/AcrR family transcriptional regulator n=1 Tax=Brevibacterium TaxID=1696 RepID=UPI00211C34DC|nr:MULTISPECIES: TetR/AcrR family transcriptional regulator [unclassified Brevibacterium]MCQ9366647.1 TetR/AcrR family transcriptional regulator [Brevibacterium sp. 91QC2O2]MCQ9384471.1 TetR/AcrR family transcriptional regulator [Brevibacterium sp. 68QC2CO]MCQ9389613.1 TetR/AcrR family transcriptional regulator [Brevibacterium sp. 50QC2O2]